MVLGLALVLGGCATTARRPPDALRRACERDMAADESCVSLLTRPSDGYEAKAEVQAAEQARKAGVFRDRLARLRAAHEARVAERIRTGTVAAAPDAPGGPRGADVDDDVEDEPGDDELQAQLDLLAQEDALDTGSSVRAMTAAPPPPAPAPAPPPTLPPPARLGPTPEQWLRGARCVLEADRAALRASMEALRSQGARATAGELALLVVDVQTLEGRIDEELAHRKLAKNGPLCSSSQLRGAVTELRRVLGEPPSGRGVAARYGRGLAELIETLEIRAGLPRAR